MHTEHRKRLTAKAIFAGLAAILIWLTPAAAEAPASFTVRGVVGRPLQESIEAATAGDFKKAMTCVEQAEAAGELNDEERSAIAQMKDYIATKSGGTYGVASALGAQAKFSSDWFAGKYRDVINDEELLRRYHALTDVDIVVIAQAFEVLGDYKGCARYASGQTTLSPSLTERQLLCIIKANDDNLVRPAIVDALGTAMAALQTGHPDKAAEHLQKAIATTGRNADEESIVTRMQAYIDAKSQQPGADLRPQGPHPGQPSPVMKDNNTPPRPSAEP